MKTQHTPGPWKITKNTTPGQFGVDTKIRAQDDSMIALVGPCEVEANARLIAAAPGLLAVVKESVSAWDAWRASPEDDGSEEPEYIAQGRALLEQIGGGE